MMRVRPKNMYIVCKNEYSNGDFANVVLITNV